MPNAEPIYLDCAATTPVDPRVRDVVLHYLDVEFGNAGSRTHDFGDRARAAVERARGQVAAVAAASRSEVVFTSGATESNNLAILGLLEFGLASGRRHIVSTRIEHHAVLEPLGRLAKRDFEVTLIAPGEDGAVDADAIAGALRPDTLLVSVMQVNNETGVCQPIREIAERLARLQHAAYFHVDAAQGFGKQLAPLQHPRIDLISVSAHKLYAPKGVGALIARRRGGERPPLAPLMLGGGQELGLRPGTLPVALVAGFGEAAAIALAEADERNARCQRFKQLLLAGLRPLEPAINGDLARMVPQTVNLSIPGIDSESAIAATRDIVAISNGAACTTATNTCSHVLEAMGLSAERMDGALRFSWHHDTEQPDWPAFVAAIERLRSEICKSVGRTASPPEKHLDGLAARPPV